MQLPSGTEGHVQKQESKWHTHAKRPLHVDTYKRSSLAFRAKVPRQLTHSVEEKME